MVPVVTCAFKGSKSIELLKKSIELYSPETELIIHSYETKTSFGETFNYILDEVFKKYDEVIISNDDVVVTPNSIQKLLSDVELLKTSDIKKLGFVQSLVDNGRYVQNIRFKFFKDERPENCKWPSEGRIKLVPVIAPIFAYFSKEAFTDCRFPPLNWYSDDVICEDLIRKGYSHFVSTSYVHHSFSETIGVDYQKLHDEAIPWIYENRPEYIEEFKRRSSLPDGI